MAGGRARSRCGRGRGPDRFCRDGGRAGALAVSVATMGVAIPGVGCVRDHWRRPVRGRIGVGVRVVACAVLVVVLKVYCFLLLFFHSSLLTLARARPILRREAHFLFFLPLPNAIYRPYATSRVSCCGGGRTVASG